MNDVPDDFTTGEEWLIDAYGCDPSTLRSAPALESLFESVVRALDLHPLAPPAWHTFPGAGGVTGLLMLTESHLSAHTFPELGFAAFDLYSCRPRPSWDWSASLRERLGAERVIVRRVVRGGRPDSEPVLERP
jgi:S-adenosylmethionine decarboxylase